MVEPFDPDKDARNRLERGLSLSVGFEVIDSALIQFEDTRFDYGERRIVCFGEVAVFKPVDGVRHRRLCPSSSDQ